MSDRITSVRGFPVRTELAGRVYLVWEARLCDLETLQAWLDTQAPDPLAGLAEGLDAAGTDPVARDKVLFTVYGRLQEGRPTLESPEGHEAVFRTPDGLALFVRTALTRGTPTLDDEALLAIMAEITLPWLESVQRAFYGTEPLRIIGGLLGLPPSRARGEPMTWSESIVSLAVDTGWTIDYVMGLTLTEFVSARNRGKQREQGLRISPHLMAAVEDRMCRALYGVSAAEHFGRPKPPDLPTGEPKWVHPVTSEGRGEGLSV